MGWGEVVCVCEDGVCGVRRVGFACVCGEEVFPSSRKRLSVQCYLSGSSENASLTPIGLPVQPPPFWSKSVTCTVLMKADSWKVLGGRSGGGGQEALKNLVL